MKEDFPKTFRLLMILLNNNACEKTMNPAKVIFSIGDKSSLMSKGMSKREKSSKNPEFTLSGKCMKIPILKIIRRINSKRILMKFKFLNC